MRTEQQTKAPRDSLGRALALGLGLVALLAVGGWFLFEHFVARPPRPVLAASVTPPPESRPAPDVRATVIGVEGAVERTRGTQWVELHEGDVLAPDDSVRTGPGARAELRVGDEASRLTIPERSELKVGEVTRDVHTIQLARGRIDVDYRDQEDRVLRVQVESGTVAETRAAHFTMLRSGTRVAVATQGGSVSVSSAGATVQVGAGQRSVVFDGARPLAAEPIPLEVLLKVAEKAALDDSLCLSFTGTVHVGAEVWVEGEPKEVSPDGSFRADVPRRQGRSQVKVVAREPGGAIREQLLACRPRARAGPPPSQPESVKFRWEEAP